MYFIELISDMGKIFAQYWYQFLVKGVGYTLLLSLIAVGAGVLFGSLLAVLRLFNIKVLNFFISAFVEVVRGTPALLQLYVGYFLLPMMIPGMNLSPFFCVAVALAVNSSAYVSEIIRSGIEAVDKGQTEAARSLGLGRAVTMTDIVLPQAVRNILPALGNEFITVIKETSLASTFFVGELMTVYLQIKGVVYKPMPTLMIVGVVYFVLNFTLSRLMKKFERRLKTRA